MKDFMNVICISKCIITAPQIEVGQSYLIDRKSISIDSDGDSHGDVYNENGEYLCRLLLNHFRSV